MMNRAPLILLLPFALLAAMIVSAVAQTAQQGGSSDPWFESLRGAKGTVVGDLKPRFEEGTETGAPPGAGTSGEPSGPTAAGGPGGVDPADPKTAGYIREWINIAEPPPNATEGANFHYTYRGNMVGTTADGGIIKSPHETGAFDAVWLWVNRRALDSVNHCTMEEYVLAKLAEKPIDHCRGRYKAPPAFNLADYTRQPVEKAKRALTEKKLKVKVVKGDPAPSKALEDTVADQEPKSGSQVRRGRLVTLTVYGDYQVSKKDREGIEQAIASCRFKEAKRLLDGVETDAARQPLARLYEEAQKREEKTKALFAKADQLYLNCDFDGAKASLTEAAGMTRCERYRTQIREAQDKVGAGRQREQKTKDLFAEADRQFKSCSYDDALSALARAREQTRCDRYRTQIEEAHKKATSAASREKKTKSLFGEADRLFKACKFDEARDRLNAARQNTKCSKYAQKIESVVRKIDAGAAHEERTKSLFAEADRLFKARDFGTALSKLNAAKANTRCERFVSQIDGAIARVKDGLGQPSVATGGGGGAPQQQGTPYFVGDWAFSPGACTGAPAPRRETRRETPGSLGEAIGQGIAEGIEQAILTIRYRFFANGELFLVKPGGESQRFGSWRVQNGVLMMKIKDETSHAKILETHADRMVVLGPQNNKRVTMFRCGTASVTSGGASSQAPRNQYDCSVDRQYMTGSDKFCDTYVERLSDYKWIKHVVNKDKSGRLRLPSTWKHGRFDTCEVLSRDSDQDCANWKSRNRR